MDTDKVTDAQEVVDEIRALSEDATRMASRMERLHNTGIATGMFDNQRLSNALRLLGDLRDELQASLQPQAYQPSRYPPDWCYAVYALASDENVTQCEAEFRLREYAPQQYGLDLETLRPHETKDLLARIAAGLVKIPDATRQRLNALRGRWDPTRLAIMRVAGASRSCPVCGHRTVEFGRLHVCDIDSCRVICSDCTCAIAPDLQRERNLHEDDIPF